MLSKDRINFYRNLGLKITPQRLAILEYLEGNTSHPTAEDIYRHVSQQFPSMSFATVYNTLEALKEKGLVMELHVEGGKKRFDPNTEPHHHFYCLSCGRIIDIYGEVRADIPEQYSKKLEIYGLRVLFLGKCDKCS
ncbi:transcriptional repressor [Thermosulfurimonas sp. F29]|nr:transcriptional repressor [Thermosulfurimonas sp. F29]